MDNCPERMDAADAEAPRPPRIGTAVEFWSGLGTEVEEAAVLKLRRVFWCTRKKIQDKTLFLLFFLPESLFVRGSAARMQAVDSCPERMHLAALLF